ncbi:hypothetical protein [Halococcus saccharolyticus]|uniref:hypothetical protein n=1 Tax=Halococcus saccharolyticus TaxID=62319 RepID=UPI000677D562|nr:hypothetical protein [Halococcus saccharolyticus]
MDILVTLLRLSATLSVVLLVGLIYVWGRNYLIFRSKHAIGLLVFAGILLVQTTITAYFYTFHPVVSGWVANPELVHPLPLLVMSSAQVLELGGIAFIAWISWD